MDLFVSLQKIVPQKTITFLAGCLADVSWVPVKNFLISQFAKAYKVDLSEARALSISQYATFNEFFTRELKEGARPIDQGEGSVVSPADGVISELGPIERGKIIQAKGVYYSVENLVGDAGVADQLEGGVFATIYLSPRDYHRVHMPVGGKSTSLTYIPGKLFSVNQRTADNLESLFARNERVVTCFEQDGEPFCVVMVGAMIVGGVETVLTGKISRTKEIQAPKVAGHELGKGDELGRFYLGSTAIVLLPKSMAAEFKDGLAAGSSVRMGEKIASLSV